MTEDLDRRLRRLLASGDGDALVDLGCDLADAGRHALEKVLTVLEPDPRRRAELREAGRRTSAQLGRVDSEPGSRSRHPAGRARGPQPEAPRPPRLVLLPGGLA